MTDDTDQDAGTNRRRADRYWRFDPQVNTGHLLQIAVIVAGILSAYGTLDKRVTLADQRAEAAKTAATERDARVKDDLAEIKAEVRELRRGVEDLARRVGTAK